MRERAIHSVAITRWSLVKGATKRMGESFRDAVGEREELGLVDGIAEEYEKLYGLLRFDVSHWDPSESTVENLSSRLRFPDVSVVMPYLYSEELEAIVALMKAHPKELAQRVVFGLSTPRRSK